MSDVLEKMETVKPFQFLITTGAGCVWVRWLRRLGKPRCGLYRVLEEQLEEIDGVEAIHVGRYSACLEVADHVATVREVAEEVAEVLESDQEVALAMRFGFPGERPEVTSIDGVLRV
jgi:hypothetical protein